MTTFQVHTIESAPEGSRPTLTQAQKTLGFVPNLYGVFAESPATLKAYATLGGIFDSSTAFSPTERQVILLSVIFENECDYCMAAHSTIAGMQNVPDHVVEALRNGEPIRDARLEALRAFTRKLTRERGWVSEPDVETFLEAGYAKAQVLEVVLGVAMKILSNYTNHITRTPVDEAFQEHTWTPPSKVSTA